MSKRVSRNVVHEIIRQKRASKGPARWPRGPGLAPTYLVRWLSTYFLPDSAPQTLQPDCRHALLRDKRYKGKLGMAAYADKVVSDTFPSVVLSPLGEKLPINASESERADGWTALNRHMVLHGESVDYGTKINS